MFDYSGGIAALIGDRTFNVSIWSSFGPGFATNYGNYALVLNADGWADIIYEFTQHFKASAGLRGDVYGLRVLTTYDVGTGRAREHQPLLWRPLRAIDRLFLSTRSGRAELIADRRFRA